MLTYPPYAFSIHHDGSGRYVQSNSGEGGLRLGDKVKIRLRAMSDVPIERIFLRACPDGEQEFIEMQPEQEGPACRWWEVTLRLTMPIVNYRFLIFAEDGAWWYNGSGLHRHTPTDAEDFRLLADYAAPSWVWRSVFYQIFPDRFANGDPSNDVLDGEFTYLGVPARKRRWGEPPTPSGPEAMVEFYGGDLIGIEQHLDYLTDLGVNALYLNPIFTAPSNHRYDVIDYTNVDPHLGGDAALISLRRATAEWGLRLILDIVPNHCGVNHPWFQAALADPHAPTAEHFIFYHHPDDYACWLGVRSLPKLNYRSMALREIMYSGPDAIFRRWLRSPYSIDGWRIDVTNMLARHGVDQLGLEVGRGIRKAVKEENPAAYLVGENFFDASAQLQGDCWDAVMNYAGFTMPLWHWLSRFEVRQYGRLIRPSSDLPWPTRALVETWEAYRAAIPWAIARQQFNLLGSHDTPRILTIVGGDQARNRLAAGLLMTYVGVPCVYYGDEIGLGDSRDTTARGCMAWDRSTWDEELRAFYQKLIKLRRTSPALIDGGFQVLLVEEDTLAYLRDAEEEQLIVVGHRGPGNRPASPLPVAHGAIPDGVEFIEIFSGMRARVVNGHLPLPAMSPGVMVWRAGS
ncbi:MAG: alpha-amylase family glycosyl hydrolase [Candidatus Acetothermia bacterium]|nr:alpha-amylase family glycosyl hydrolase [Candidatus Acetothermia bacterium]MDH7505879.1 alpha-amylase family glycosyl hydrolase [Candidatus Acetothermia bacterium]